MPPGGSRHIGLVGDEPRHTGLSGLSPLGSKFNLSFTAVVSGSSSHGSRALGLSFHGVDQSNKPLNLSFTSQTSLNYRPVNLSFTSGNVDNQVINISFNSESILRNIANISFTSEAIKNNVTNLSFTSDITHTNKINTSFSSDAVLSVRIGFSFKSGNVKNHSIGLSFNSEEAYPSTLGISFNGTLTHSYTIPLSFSGGPYSSMIGLSFGGTQYSVSNTIGLSYNTPGAPTGNKSPGFVFYGQKPGGMIIGIGRARRSGLNKYKPYIVPR